MVSAKRKIGFYEKYIKRLFDIVCSLLAVRNHCGFGQDEAGFTCVIHTA